MTGETPFAHSLDWIDISYSFATNTKMVFRMRRRGRDYPTLIGGKIRLTVTQSAGFTMHDMSFVLDLLLHALETP